MKRLCAQHVIEAKEFGDEDVELDNENCEKCYDLSGRDPYDRDMTEPYEP